jgi:putative DNA primase/helicase
VLPILWGVGANGKTTFLNAVMDMLGPDYAMKAATDLLMVKRNTHPTEKADLFGKRLVVASETEENRRLAESLVKELTGSERIRARRMREDFWEFSPTHKLVLCTNHKPIIRGTDHAIWRRLRLVPFSVVIPDDQQDTTLPDKLRAEATGILNWCLAGCLEWQQHSEQPPKAVTTATQGYRLSQDVLQLFLEECCVESDGIRAKASDLYDTYKAWCERSGEHPENQRQFGEAMTDHGFERKVSNGTWYIGVGLQDDRLDND